MVTQSRKPSELREKGKRQAREEAADRWARGPLKRTVGTLPPRKRFLLVCEGEKTEPLYFESFKRICKQPISLRVLGGEGVPVSVVETAIKHKKKSRGAYDEVWAVFDRDSFDEDQLHKAFDKARHADVRIAFSNEAFELWYLLHYELRNSGMSRQEYKKKLSHLMGKEYEKNDPAMFQLVRPLLRNAMRHASSLCGGMECWAHEAIGINPFTGVHHLVYSLLENETGDEMEAVRGAYRR